MNLFKHDFAEPQLAQTKGPVIKYRGVGWKKCGGGSPIFQSLKGGGSLKIEHRYGGGSR